MQRFFTILFAVSFIYISCRKVLDLQPLNSFSTNSAFSTPDLCLASLKGVYAVAEVGLGNSSVYSGILGSINIGQTDVRGEDLIIYANLYGDVYQSAVIPASPTVSSFWAGAYAIINTANLAIQGFQTAGNNGVITQALATEYIAECSFIRAFIYHELVLNFCRPYLDNNGTNLGVPYRTTPINGLEDIGNLKNTPRGTVAQTYQGIINDLDFAIANLPATSLDPNNPNTRATQAAAMMLKMRVLMHTGDWATVLSVGNQLVPSVLNPITPSSNICPIGGWALTALPDGPFANNVSSEGVFSIKNSTNTNPGGNTALAALFGAASIQGGRGYLAVSPIIWNDTNSWKCNDLRRSLLYAVGTNAGSTQNYFTTKYRNYLTLSDYAPQIRYAEAFLTLAEAEARINGRLQRAIDLINIVRNRSLPDPASQQYTLASFQNAVQLVQAILRERRVELLAEGKRWGDISRTVLDINYSTNGVPAKYPPSFSDGITAYECGGTISPTLPAVPYSSYSFVWPIPSQEIQNNPIIVQNPGY
ncbi:MAG: RagB/SusD family nutrient uptake outer membrane protein [Phycisphaerales bacterium]|nr:RagB/SusD family nutrient uptake outer membrane protein [Phycisphaerales bacterium]